MTTHTGNHLEDKLLVDGALRGNANAFRQIIEKTERLVAGIVFRMISDPEDRKDMAQDIYLKVYRKLPGFKFESKLSTWIARISYNTCMDCLRKKKPVLWDPLLDGEETGRAAPETGPAHHFSNEAGFDPIRQRELAGILQEEMEKLSPVYKTLVTLFHQEELSYQEIGEITGLPAGTVKSYLFRARARLRKSLLRTYKKEDL